MSKTEFNLSKKIIETLSNSNKSYFAIEDVKEFIRLLKEFGSTHDCDYPCSCSKWGNKAIKKDQNCWVIPKKELDKLAGEKLK